MKKFLNFFGSLLIVSLVSACGGASSINGEFTAEVLKAHPLKEDEDPSKALVFAYGPQKLTTITQLDKLEGRYFQMGRSKLTIEEAPHDRDIKINKTLSFLPPKLVYEINNGVVVPKSHETLLMLSSYYQFEQIALKLESLTGISMDAIVKERGGPIRLHFHPVTYIEGNGFNSKYRPKRNAAFDPYSFQFLIFKDSADERIPMGANLAVIAHEFGHLVFEWILRLNGTSASHHSDIKGLDEGFADYFSYSVTGSSNLLENSFGAVAAAEQRNFSSFNYSYRDYRADSSWVNVAPRRCTGGYYCLGTLFAKTLFQTQKKLYPSGNYLEDRAVFLKRVVQGLTENKTAFHARGITESDDSHLVLGHFFRGMLLNVPGSQVKRAFLDNIVDVFGETGFRSGFREGL